MQSNHLLLEILVENGKIYENLWFLFLLFQIEQQNISVVTIKL